MNVEKNYFKQETKWTQKHKNYTVKKSFIHPTKTNLKEQENSNSEEIKLNNTITLNDSFMSRNKTGVAFFI